MRRSISFVRVLEPGFQYEGSWFEGALEAGSVQRRELGAREQKKIARAAIAVNMEDGMDERWGAGVEALRCDEGQGIERRSRGCDGSVDGRGDGGVEGRKRWREGMGGCLGFS